VTFALACLVPSCYSAAFSRGLCNRHLQQHIAGKPLTEAPTLAERFMENVRVDAEGCWLWTGTVAGRYGQFLVFGKKVPANRVAYELFVGRATEKMHVCHRCDVPMCVRPDHLFLGTPSENVQDMVAKGRHPKQRASYRAKITPQQAREIRESSASLAELGRQYGLNPRTIGQIKRYETWKAVQ